MVGEEIDGLRDGGIEDLLDLQRDLHGGAHPVLVLADGPPGDPKEVGEIAEGELLILPEGMEEHLIDIHVEPARRDIDEGRDPLHQEVGEGGDRYGIDPVADIDRSPLEVRVPGPLPHDEGSPAQVIGDEIQVPCDILGDSVDMGDGLDDHEDPGVPGDEIEGTGPLAASLRDLETRVKEQAPHPLEQDLLCHGFLKNPYSVAG